MPLRDFGPYETIFTNVWRYNRCHGNMLLERTCYQNEQQIAKKKKKCSSMFLVAKEVWENQHEDGLRP
jgi:hypothetical protein